MRALISLHDVMPDTMPRCESILSRLKELEMPPIPLLVVPGRAWDVDQLSRLRALVDAGHEIVAHGWHHRTTPKRLYHRLHAAVISRNVAEHLALNSGEILVLLQRSQDWFTKNALPQPSTYVPPAWALGAIRTDDLAQSPFTRIEVTRGILFPHEGCRLARLPLSGYEADTIIRERLLRIWNATQVRQARRGRILRISLHPDDFQLRAANQITKHLGAVTECLNYDQI